jgi:hypothetical protein
MGWLIPGLPAVIEAEPTPSGKGRLRGRGQKSANREMREIRESGRSFWRGSCGESIGQSAASVAVEHLSSEGFAGRSMFHNPTHFMPKRSQSGMVIRPASDVPSTTRKAVAGSPP